MAKPGPQKGWKQPLLSQEAQGETSVPTNTLTAEQKNNPSKLSGDDLRHLAHQLGMAKSTLADMPDVKIREQLKFLTFRRYEDAVE